MNLNKIIKNIEYEENAFIQDRNINNMGFKYFFNKFFSSPNSDYNNYVYMFIVSSFMCFIIICIGIIGLSQNNIYTLNSFISILTLLSTPFFISFISLFAFDKIYYKIKFKMVKNKRDKDILLKKAFLWDFDKKKISNDITNQLKIILTQKDYQNLMLNYKNSYGFINYQQLKIFLNKQKELQNILDEQMNVTLSEVKIKELIN